MSKFLALICAQGVMDKIMTNNHLFPKSIRAIHCDSRKNISSNKPGKTSIRTIHCDPRTVFLKISLEKSLITKPLTVYFYISHSLFEMNTCLYSLRLT